MEPEYLNILLYSNSFLPSIGGREIVVYHLAKELQLAGHKVQVVASGGARKYRHLSYPFPVSRWPSLPGVETTTAASMMLAWSAAWKQFHVINAHATYPVGMAALKYKSYSGIPLVVTPHGEDIHVIPEIGHGLRLDPQLARQIEKVVSEAEYLTAISGSVRASLLDAGAEQARIVDIPNGVDFARFSGKYAMDVRQRYGIATDQRIILTVGNYVRRRGHEELVRAMQAIREADEKAHLVIIGRGTEVLKPLIDELGITNAITLTGAIPPIELNPQGEDLVAAFYQESEIYAVAGMSEGSEGLSLALLDAMAAESAIVATRISGNRDVIEDGVNGLLVEPGKPHALAEGIGRLLADTQLQQQCRKAAISTVQPYSWTRIAQKYVQTYRDAMNHG